MGRDVWRDFSTRITSLVRFKFGHGWINFFLSHSEASQKDDEAALILMERSQPIHPYPSGKGWDFMPSDLVSNRGFALYACAKAFSGKVDLGSIVSAYRRTTCMCHVYACCGGMRIR